MNTGRNITTALFLCLIPMLIAGLDLFIGLGDVSPEERTLIIDLIRIPRVLTAFLAGGGLALAGAQMQSILRNPLADPHILGITSGASLGAAIATLAGAGAASGVLLQGISVAVASIIGAATASVIIITASLRFRDPSTLLIFGVMLGFVVNAIVTIMQSGSDAESLKVFHSWSAGSFSTTSLTDIYIMAVALCAGFILAGFNRNGLDIILFGDEFSLLSGARPDRIRMCALLSCCIITGSVTAFCGPLGFVGIIAPHIARALFGSSVHKIILPASFLCGGITGLAADLISQTAHTPLPVSSTMAVVGIPVIIYILLKKPESLL